MVSAMMKLSNTKSFRTRSRFMAPSVAVAGGHTAPIFLRLMS
jgi:hypothetical protein